MFLNLPRCGRDRVAVPVNGKVHLPFQLINAYFASLNGQPERLGERGTAELADVDRAVIEHRATINKSLLR